MHMNEGVINKGEGPGLILIHGFCENNWMWSDAVDRLANRFNVLAIDLPGFGDRNEETVLSINDAATFVMDQMSQYRIPKAVIAGHSMGGYVALSALRNHPDRVVGVSLINSHASADTLLKSQNRLKTIEFLRNFGSEEFLQLFVKDLLSEDHEDNEVWIEELHQMVSRTPLNSIISALYKMIERRDQKDLLKTTNIPIQALIGTQDKMADFREVLEQVSVLAVGDVHLFPSGHLGIKEMPEEYLRALAKFVVFCNS